MKLGVEVGLCAKSCLVEVWVIERSLQNSYWLSEALGFLRQLASWGQRRREALGFLMAEAL